MEVVETQTESNILSRLIAPRDGGMSIEAANSVLEFGFSDRDIDRMNELAEKNRQGTVSSDEREELESYSRVGNLLNLLQAKARQSVASG